MYVQGDASQLEWRTAIILSNDHTGIREINNGDDTHSLNQKAFDLPSRLISKTYLFRTIFRGSGYAFANDSSFSHVSSDPKYWDNVNAMFYSKYSSLDKLHHDWYKLSAQRQPILGPTGSSWLIPLRPNGKVNENAVSNYPVQGTAADIVATARIALWNRLRLRGLVKRWLMCLSVHDSIVLDVPPEETQEAANLIYEVFNDLPELLQKVFHWEIPIPLAAEVKVGDNLLEMKELKYAS